MPATLVGAWKLVKIQWKEAPSTNMAMTQEKTNAFFTCAMDELENKLIAEVKMKEVIAREEAEEYFTFFEQIPRNTVKICNAIFFVCNKCSYTHPQKSFDWTILSFYGLFKAGRVLQMSPAGTGKVLDYNRRS